MLVYKELLLDGSFLVFHGCGLHILRSHGHDLSPPGEVSTIDALGWDSI